MSDQLLSLLSLATIALASYGLGRPIVRGLGVGEEDRLSAGVWSVAMGLVVGGTLLAVLGLMGALYASLIGVLSLAACFWGLGQLVAGSGRNEDETTVIALSTSAPAEAPGPAPWPSPARWLSGGILAAAALACLGSLLSAMAPPTAGDALCYHLELPKAFLADHAITYLPYSENSTYPLLVEMWYLWALALDGGVSAQMVHWGAGVLLGLATVVLATPLVGRPWGWVAGAVVVLVPGVNNQMTAPLNDVALALLTTLATAAWWQAVSADGNRRWLVLAGLAAGGALGTKYIAFVYAAAVAIAYVGICWRGPMRRRELPVAAAIVGVVALSVGGLWYVRAAWYRGNPVYPFLSEVFTAKGADATETKETLPASKSPLGRKPSGALAAPWQVTMHPERFGGRGHQLGVLFLAAAPGLLIVRRLRGLGTLLAVATAYGLLWFLLRQNVRFLLPAAPLLAVAVVWVWIETERFPRLPRLFAGATFAGVVALYALVPLARSADQLAVAVGLESREDYLARHEPTWAAAEASNLCFGPNAHLLSQDYRAFYFQCRVTRESVYRRVTGYDRGITRPGDFSRTLREAGFTHLLLAENQAEEGVRYDPTLTRLAEAEWSAGGAGHNLLELAQ
ncbi:MAG: glycosyltransferase family 39 protein [Planctomycetes bacterium]|nr:glycosyltransferase family 39 protein [Planctomycetota bacterium]